MSASNSIRYLCGKDGADTTEHVVPRCLYVGKLPSDVITLPAHERCNKATARDEEAFRNHISVTIPAGKPGHGLWVKTWRAIHRPEAAGMQKEFYSEMLSELVRDDDGVLRPSPVAASIKEQRADWVLAKIVKGLYTRETGELLPSSKIRWCFGSAEVGHEEIALPRTFAVHDVLAVKWGRVHREPFATMWILGLHASVWFWVTTTSATRTLSNRSRGARPMIWPPPIGARRAPTQGGMRTAELVRWDWMMIDTAEFAACSIVRAKTGEVQRLEVPAVLRPFLRGWWERAGKPTAGAVFPVRRGKRVGQARTGRGVSFASRLRRELFRAGVVRFPPVVGLDGKPAPHPADPLYSDTPASKRVDFHSFRRAYNTALADAGVNVQTAMGLASHSDPKTHMRYVMAAEAARPVPIAALPNIDPGLAARLLSPPVTDRSGNDIKNVGLLSLRGG